MKPLSSRQRSAVLLAGAAVLLAVGIPLTTTAAARVAMTTGMTGITGTLRVTSCVQPQDRGARVYCVGEFTSDDGGQHDPAAAVTADSAPGRSLLVHRDAAGHYAPGGAAAALGWSAMVFLGLALLSLAVTCLPAWRRLPGATHSAVRFTVLMWSAVLLSALASVGVSLASAL